MLSRPRCQQRPQVSKFLTWLKGHKYLPVSLHFWNQDWFHWNLWECFQFLKCQGYIFRLYQNRFFLWNLNLLPQKSQGPLRNFLLSPLLYPHWSWNLPAGRPQQKNREIQSGIRPGAVPQYQNSGIELNWRRAGKTGMNVLRFLPVKSAQKTKILRWHSE